MPSQPNTRTSRINQVAFTYSSNAQTFIWLNREKLARPTLRRSKSVLSGLDKQ